MKFSIRILRGVLPVLVVLLAGCAATVSSPVLPEEPVVDAPYVSRLDDPASNALYHYGRAQMLLGEAAIEPAIDALLAAIELDPQSLELRYNLAQIYAETGQAKQARRTLEDILISHPDALAAHLSLGNMALAHGEPEQALTYFRRVMELEPDNVMVPLQMSIALVRLGEIDQATDVLKQLLERVPDSRPGRLTLGRLYRDMGMDARAEEQYRYLIDNLDGVEQAYLDLGYLFESQNNWDQALEMFQEALTLNPYDLALRHHVARMYVNMQEFDKALKELREIIAVDPDDVEARRKIGLIYVEQERWEEAATLFKEILVLDPGLEPARYYLGTILERQEKWQDALDAFSDIPETSSLYGDAISHLGFLLLKLDRTEDAAALLEYYLEQGEARPQIYYYLAVIYQSDGHFDQALRTLEQGLLQFSEDIDLLYQQGIVLEQLKMKKQALEVMQAVVARDANHAEALNFIAYAYAEANTNLAEALDLAERAIALKPAGHIHDTLGWIYYRLGHYSEALRAARSAHMMLPDDDVVLGHLAEILMAMEQYVQAREIYLQLQKNDPDNPLPKEKLDALDSMP